MKQNVAINFFSPVGKKSDVDAETGLRFAQVTEGSFILEVGEEKFPGFQTNEAPLANAVDLLAREGERMHRVYCLVTPQCLSKEMGGEDSGIVILEKGTRSIYPTQFDFWCARMKRLRPALDDTVFIPIPLRCREYTLIEDIEGQVAALTDRIKVDAGGSAAWEDCHIYADITGGARYVNMMMTSVLQFLQYDGMQIEKMLYADLRTLSQENRVFDVRAAGDVYKLVAGADAFVSYGVSRTIEEYFGYDAQTGRAKKPISDALKGVLGAMHGFSDAIQICQTGNIPHALSALSEALAAFLDVPEEKRTVDDRMFMQLIDTITEGYGVLLREPDEETERYEAIIRWCAEKGLLQQAMTLATEWLPICFVRRRIVCPAPKFAPCAERTVDAMHPGWMQNFIINPTTYRSSISEVYSKAFRPMLDLAIKEGRVAQDAPPFMNAIAKVHNTFYARNRVMNLVAFNKLPADVRWICQYVCKQLTQKKNSGDWSIKRLLKAPDIFKLIKDQILKKKNDFLIFRLLGIENCTFLLGSSNDIDARWHSWEDAWTKMVEVMGIVQTNCGKELMLACLRTYFYLREQRNQVNHATAENVLRRTEIEMFLNNALAALSAASSDLQKEKM